MSTWINKIVELHPTDETVPALLVNQLVRVERDRSLNGLQLQEHSVEYLRVYEFGHFHHAWCSSWYALEIQYLYLKTETRLLTDAFVCKHQVVAWNSVLSEQFDEPAVICTGKDGLRWVTFFLLKMWVSYFPITIYMENLSTSTQKSNRIIMRTMAQNTWRGWCKKTECWIKEALYIEWACQTLPSFEQDQW